MSADPAARWRASAAIEVIPLRTATLPPATHTNAFLLGAGQEVALVEPAPELVSPGAPPILDALVQEIAASGRTLRALLATHHHPDHLDRSALRFGLPLWAHPETGRLAGVPIDRALGEGDSFLLGSDRFQVMHTPGHAAGHLCFIEEATQIGIVGDMIASVGTILIDPDEGDMARYLEELKRLAERGLSGVIPAHGGWIAEPSIAFEHLRQHRLKREEKVISHLEIAPKSLLQLTQEVYSDVPEALHAIASRSLLAHLLKLEREGRAQKSRGAWALSP